MSATLSSAVKVLLVGGVLNIVFSFVLGWLLSLKRMKEPMPPHHWLLVAHTVSLQEGLMLLGLSWGLTFAEMSGTLAIVGTVFRAPCSKTKGSSLRSIGSAPMPMPMA